MELVDTSNFYDPPSDEACTAHNHPRPCRQCYIAEVEFMAEIAQEERTEREKR